MYISNFDIKTRLVFDFLRSNNDIRMSLSILCSNGISTISIRVKLEIFQCGSGLNELMLPPATSFSY